MLHVILTRFNIASPGREVAIRNSPGWLERRFELFERYCLPSVADQTISNFKWLIYFDENIPGHFRERIERARQKIAFTPHFVGVTRAGFAIPDVQDLVDRFQTDGDVVVTTRLDNDDAIARDFVRNVQLAAGQHEIGTVLNFPNGVAMRQGRLFTAHDLSNPFTSLVEARTAPVKTIWSAQHHMLGQKWNLVQIETPPMWLQVVHGENVTNRIKGRQLPADTILNNFSLGPDVEAAPVSSVRLLLDRVLLGPARMLRERIFLIGKPFFKKVLRR